MIPDPEIEVVETASQPPPSAKAASEAKAALVPKTFAAKAI